jgi:hypothetical protein
MVCAGGPVRGNLSSSASSAFYVEAAVAVGANGVTAGEFVVDPPTLINLGFEWFIYGPRP